MQILDVNRYSLKYIEFIKTKKCTACYTTPVDPDHLISVGMGHNRKNPMLEHFTCIPLCRQCHTERHQIGNELFEKKHKVDLWRDAFNYLMEFLTTQ